MTRIDRLKAGDKKDDAASLICGFGRHSTRFANALADTGHTKVAVLLTATRARYAVANSCEWPAGCETDVGLLAGSRPHVFPVKGNSPLRMTAYAYFIIIINWICAKTGQRPGARQRRQQHLPATAQHLPASLNIKVEMPLYARVSRDIIALPVNVTADITSQTPN